MRRHIILGFQFGRQFRHRDIRLRLDPLEQSRQMRRQFTSPRRTTLPRWPGRTRPRYQIRQLYCKACADIVPPRRRPARLTAIDLRLNPFPKINRIRLPHPCWPPSIPASILNQTSDSLGIPFRFLFHARRSSRSQHGEVASSAKSHECDEIQGAGPPRRLKSALLGWSCGFPDLRLEYGRRLIGWSGWSQSSRHVPSRTAR